MPSLRVASIFVFLASVLVAGCGGGGSGSLPATGGAKAEGTHVALTLDIPKPAVSAGKKKPGYVSPAIASVVIAISSNQTTQVNAGSNYVNVTSSSNGCTTSASGTTCTVDIATTISSAGTYSLVVAAYDAAQSTSCLPNATPACAGNLLSLAALPATITPGQTTPVAVTMGGVPAYLQPVELGSGYISTANGRSSSSFIVYGPGAKTVEFELLDAQKKIIAGPGAPVVTVTSTNASVLNATIATPDPSGLYVLTLTPQTTTSAAGPVVQPTTVPVNIAVSVPGTSLAASIAPALLVQITHAALYMLHPGSANTPNCSSPGTSTLDVFLDGNTTSSQNAYCAGTTNVGLGVDPSGNVWVADGYNDDLIEFYPFLGNGGSQGPGPSIYATPGNGLGNPDNVTFDSAGNAYVTNGHPTTPFTLVEYDVPAPGASPSFSAPARTYYSSATNNPVYIAVDNAGPSSAAAHIYTSYYSSPNYNLIAFDYGVPTPISLPFSGSSLLALSIEPYNNWLWVLEDPSAVLINPATGTTQQTIGGLSSAATLTTDMLGNVYVGNFTGPPDVQVFSPPSFASPATPAYPYTPIQMAFYPGPLIGNEASVGVMSSPLPSPIPLPTF